MVKYKEDQVTHVKSQLTRLSWAVSFLPKYTTSMTPISPCHSRVFIEPPTQEISYPSMQLLSGNNARTRVFRIFPFQGPVDLTHLSKTMWIEESAW